MSSSRSAVLRGSAADGAATHQRTALGQPAGAPPAGAGAQVRLSDVYAGEIERLFAQARAEGHAAGYAEGLAAAEVVVREAEATAQARLVESQQAWVEQMSSTANALGEAVRRLDATTLPLGEELSRVITENAFRLVADLLGRELELATSPGQDAVRRALVLCPGDAPVEIRLNPADYASLPDGWLEMLPAHVQVQPDPSVEPAGAVARAGATRIDAQIGAALERVRKVLHP